MARADRPGSTPTAGPTIHNEGDAAVGVRVLIEGRDSTSVVAVTLAPGESHVVSAPTTAMVEIHTRDGTATAPAAGGPMFVVRDGRVLVATA